MARGFESHPSLFFIFSLDAEGADGIMGGMTNATESKELREARERYHQTYRLLVIHRAGGELADDEYTSPRLLAEHLAALNEVLEREALARDDARARRRLNRPD